MHARGANTDASPEDGATLEKLRQEHREIDRQVMTLEHKGYLTAGEDAELKRLKRLKLSKKDQLFLLARRLGVSL